MADYLTQPSSAEGSVSKIKKIRSELLKQKEEVSKKREKFAKRTLGLEVGLAMGNSALKGALDRYKLRNQPQINFLKGQQTQAKNFITQDQAAMKTHGTVENYMFSTLKDRYQEAVKLKEGEGYIYTSDHWSDELNADVAAKTKAYNDYLAAARRISEGDIDGAFKGLQEKALPSNLWQYFSRSAKQLVKGHNATTIKLKADQSFDKLINSTTFKDHKDFQTQARIYNALNPGGLQGVLSKIEGDKKERWAKIHLDSKVMPDIETKVVGGKKVQSKTNTLVITAVKEQAGTGKLETEEVLTKEYKGGTVPVEIITAQQINAFNEVLTAKGNAKLAQLLEQETYMLDPSKAFRDVINMGNTEGIENKTNVNPYLSPDVNIDEVAKSISIGLGKSMEAMLAPLTREDYPTEEEWQKAVQDRKDTLTAIGSNGADIVQTILDGIAKATTVDPLPKP